MSWLVSVSDKAGRELDGIYDYISKTLMSPISAASLTDKIEKEILSLDFMPLRYPLYDAEPWHSRGVRYFPVSSYLIFYSVNEEARTVTVHRVIYGGRDIASDLEKED